MLQSFEKKNKHTVATYGARNSNETGTRSWNNSSIVFKKKIL